MPFLKKLRNSIVKSPKLTGYFKYAFGEIILVVIGILIAVSLNNWNQSRKEKTAFKQKLAVLIADMKSDTAEARRIIRQYNEHDTVFKKILSDSMTQSDYEQHPGARGILTSINPFHIEEGGYALFQNTSQMGIPQYDTFTLKLKQDYAQLISLNELTLRMMERNVERNILYFQDHYPWFSDLVLGTFPDEYYEYLLTDPIYKNRVTYHYILIKGNYLPLLERFNKTMSTNLNLAENIMND